MLLSRNFVKDYIDLDDDLDIRQIAEDMTKVGNEYDSCGKLVNCTNLVVGEVIECKDHPDSDHLHLCKVNIGSEILDIVCGAPNVRVGIKTIVALVGAKLPGGEIKKGKIRGAESNGMLCSKEELGLDSKFLDEKDKTGIHEFNSDAVVGEDAIKTLSLEDEVIDFELTSNRGDLLSILGMAYELGAIYKKDVKDIELDYNEIEESIEGQFKVEIKTDNCSLFLAKKVKDVVIKDSPKFIQSRLIASGIRPINNVVDISNYVMLETGQPLHFYDANRLGDTIVVRMANDGEKLVTLDGQERELTSNDIVIADKEKAVGLAGVMGGLTTEVEDNTKDIVIESAIFNASSVRKTSKKVLRSEASNRFEKGIDPKRTYMAIKRAAYLLEKYASGKVLKDTISYDKTNKEDKLIEITSKDINDVLGTNISVEIIIDILKSLGFSVNIKENKLEVIVPTRRLDVNIKEDLIEEVGRIYGINNIEGKLPELGVKVGAYDKTTRTIRNKLVDLGLNEVISYVFVPENLTKTYTNEEFEPVKLLDPLSIDRAYLRNSLISTIMRIYEYNKSHNINDICIFEMAKGFYKKDNEYKEDYKLAMVLTGDYYYSLGANEKVDFYITKGIVEQLLIHLGYANRYRFEVDGNIPKELHPWQSASIYIDNEFVGIIGKIHPLVAKDDVFVVEINLDKLLAKKTSKLQFKEVSKYPTITKDLAFVVDKNVLSSEVESVIKKTGGKLLKNVVLFDLYTGEKIANNEKSLAYSLTFGDDRTLTEEEVMNLFDKIIENVTEKCKAKLRDN